MAWLEQLAVASQIDHGPIVKGHVIPDGDHVHVGPHLVQNGIGQLQPPGQRPIHEGIEEPWVQHNIHQPLFIAAQVLAQVYKAYGQRENHGIVGPLV